MRYFSRVDSQQLTSGARGKKTTRHAHSPRNRPVLWKIRITEVETRDSRKVSTSSVKTQTHRTLRMFLVIMTCIRALYWSDTTAPPRTRTQLLWPQPAGAFTRQPQASEASSRSIERVDAEKHEAKKNAKAGGAVSHEGKVGVGVPARGGGVHRLQGL